MAEGPANPRHKPDTYLKLGQRLYEVVEWVGTPETGMLRVRNIQTLHHVSLTAEEVERAEVVIAAVDAPLTIPDEWGRAAA